MDKELFANLVTSLTEARKIAKGEIKLARITTLNKSGKASKIKIKPRKQISDYTSNSAYKSMQDK